MKALQKICLGILFFIAVLSANATYFNIIIQGRNTLYSGGIDNEVVVMVEGINCKDISVNATRGSLTQAISGCHYIFRADSIGFVGFSVYIIDKYKKKKKIGVREFRIENVPPPIVRIGNIRYRDTITKQALMEEKGIILDNYSIAPVCDVIYKAVSYNIAIIDKNKSVIGVYLNEGQVFSEKIKHELSKIESGGQVLFYDVQYKDFKGETRTCLPLTLNISE